MVVAKLKIDFRLNFHDLLLREDTPKLVFHSVL